MFFLALTCGSFATVSFMSLELTLSIRQPKKKSKRCLTAAKPHATIELLSIAKGGLVSVIKVAIDQFLPFDDVQKDFSSNQKNSPLPRFHRSHHTHAAPQIFPHRS